MTLRFIVILLWAEPARAEYIKACRNSHQFGVDSCTSCFVTEPKHSDNPLAQCVKDNNEINNTKHTCFCELAADGLRYYAVNDGNVSRCIPSWETAPELFTVFSSVTAAVFIYAGAHWLYLGVFSRQCCCRDGCAVNSVVTTFEITMAVLSIMPIAAYQLIFIMAQGRIRPGTSLYGIVFLLRISHFLNRFIWGVTFSATFANMVSIVKKKSSRPRWITVCIFCDIAVAVPAVLSYLVLYLAHGLDGADFMGVLAALLFVSVAIIILLLIVELCTIQKTMRQVRPSACRVSTEVLLTLNVSLTITTPA